MKKPDDRERGILRASSVENAQPAQNELDPLAELIRIVKEEDPFADILAETRGPRSRPKFSGLRAPEPEFDEPEEPQRDDRPQVAARQPAARDAVPDLDDRAPANVQPLRPARIEPAIDGRPRQAGPKQREADEPGMVARLQRQSEPAMPRLVGEDAPVAGPVRPAALSAVEAEKARADELEAAMRRSVSSTLKTMQRSGKGQVEEKEAENEDKPVGFTNRFRLTPKADGSGVPSPTVVKPAARLAAERGNGAATQAVAPSLDPVDLEQALRQFREAPSDLLHIRPEPQVPAEPVASAHHDIRPEPAPEPAPVRAPRVAPRANPMFDEPRDLDDPAFAAYDGGEFDTYEDEFEDEYAEPIAPKRRRGGLFAAGVLLGLLLLGGGFVYSFGTDFSLSGTTAGDPPVIHADSRPTKIAPDQPGGEDIPHQNKLVYDRVNGNSETAAPEETIVPREEEVIDLANAKETDAPSDLPPGVTIAQPPTTATTVRVAPESQQPDQPVQIARADAQADTPVASSPSQDNPLIPVPRRVKTLKILPDGRVVESEPQAAAGETTSSIPAPEPEQQAAVELDQPALETAETGQLGTPAPGTPVPDMRPDYQPVRLAYNRSNEPLQLTPRQSQPAAPQTVALAPSEALPQVDTAGGYVVQLAARRSEDQAVSAFNELRSRYSVLSSYRPNIQRADLGDRGVYYRVRVGPMANKTSADQLCDDLKAAGMSDCLVRRQ